MSVIRQLAVGSEANTVTPFIPNDGMSGDHSFLTSSPNAQTTPVARRLINSASPYRATNLKVFELKSGDSHAVPASTVQNNSAAINRLRNNPAKRPAACVSWMRDLTPTSAL